MQRAEVQGRRGVGETGKGAGASSHGAPAAPGCLPGCARPRPSVRPLPPPRRVRGNTLLGTFGTRASVQPMHSQNPGVHPRPVPTISPVSPSDTLQNTGATRTYITPLLSPQAGTGLSGDLDPDGRAPEGSLNGQSMHKGTPGEIWSQEALPLKWEPHSQLTRLGVPRRRCSGVRRRERGRGGERRREIRREGGRETEEEGRGSLGGGTETETGGQAGAATALSTDNGAREGGAGRSPAKGGASLPSFPRGTLVGLLSCCGSPLALRCLSPGTFTRFLPCSPEEARCPDPLLQLADPGRRPVTQAP